MCIAAYGVTLMKTTGNIADDLPRQDPVYLDLKFFEENFQGVLPFEVTVETDKKGWGDPIVNLKANR